MMDNHIVPPAFGTKAKPLNKHRMFNSLIKILKKSGYDSQKLAKMAEIFKFADDCFVKVNQKYRKNGFDETITHSLWIALYLSIQGITDFEIQKAAILHDVSEDTGIGLDKIENIAGKNAANLVELVTKVKSKNLQSGRKALIVEKKDRKKTQEKILSALDKDIRAIILKGADVAHNQLTGAFLPQKDKTIKANSALSFFEPIIRDLGLTGMANVIGDAAFELVMPAMFKEISTKRKKIIEKISPALHKIKKTIKTLSCAGVNVQVVFNSAYKIFQLQSESSKFNQYAELNVTCDGKINKASIQKQLPEIMRLISQSTGNEITYTNGQVKTQIYFPIVGYVRLNIKNKLADIYPADLFINYKKLSVNGKKAAKKKLAEIRAEYHEALKGGNLVKDVVEGAKRGRIKVFDRDKLPYFIPLNSTALDFAYILGRRLGNATNGVLVNKLGKKNKTRIDLGSKLSPNLQLLFLTKKGLVIDKRRLDLVTTSKARKDINERIKKQKISKKRG
jgi:GTP diphosphokinase / guanosine-3',5'-bis(diphosphate) 3'-diphosphatase